VLYPFVLKIEAWPTNPRACHVGCQQILGSPDELLLQVVIALLS
jgi:hypothetical protein